MKNPSLFVIQRNIAFIKIPDLFISMALISNSSSNCSKLGNAYFLQSFPYSSFSSFCSILPTLPDALRRILCILSSVLGLLSSAVYLAFHILCKLQKVLHISLFSHLFVKTPFFFQELISRL